MPRGPLRAALPSLRDLPSETQSVSAAHSVTFGFPCPYLQSPLPTPRLRKAAVLSKEAAILLILAAKFNIMPPILTGVW